MIVWKKHLETHEAKQIYCQIIWRETVRKLIHGIEWLGYWVSQLYRKVGPKCFHTDQRYAKIPNILPCLLPYPLEI